jgi:hypothetical protein
MKTKKSIFYLSLLDVDFDDDAIDDDDDHTLNTPQQLLYIACCEQLINVMQLFILR